MNQQSEKTINQYKFYLTHLLNYTQKDKDTMQQKDLNDFITKLVSKGLQLKPISGNSQRALYSIFNSFFTFHNRSDLKLFRRDIKGRRVDEREIFSLEERDAFFEKAEQLFALKFRAFFEFSYWEALRVDEAISIRIENIDFVRNKVHIKAGKGNKDATIDLLPKAKNILQKYIAQENIKTGFIFLHKYKKGKLAGKNDKFYMVLVEQVFQKVLFELKMGKSLTFHCLRHSCGSHLLAAMGEAGLPYVQRHLRHQKGSPSTLRYLHVLNKTISAESLNKIGGI
jgi:integrase